MPEQPRTPAPSARTQLHRLPERGHYDRAAVLAVLDAGFLCHIGFVDNGAPVVIPTGYGREGDRVFFHGSAAGHMLRAAAQGVEVCLTVTLIDGLVLARSGFHSSMNYRSVMIFGRASMVSGEGEKRRALEVISERILAGRWVEIRPPSERELNATLVLALPIDEASVKIRTGPPKDDAADYDLPVWAGVLPLESRTGEPLPDPRMAPGLPLPASVSKKVGR